MDVTDMELLEFKNKFLDLCHVENVGDTKQVLYDVVMSNNIDFFEKFTSIIDDSKDWLQAIWQYYEADRKEKKQDYTPDSIKNLVSALAGETESVFDCCAGSGALSLAMLKNCKVKKIYIEEKDDNVIPYLLFNLCISNADAYVTNGDALTKEKYKCYKLTKGEKFSVCEIVTNIEEEKVNISVSNPPFNIKWEPPTGLEALMDSRFPVIPQASSANYAFVLNCFDRCKDKTIMILPNGVLSERTEQEARKYLVDNDIIETVIILPNKMFESTDISTCILVLNRNKSNKNKVCFVDSRKNYAIEERAQNGQFGGNSHTNRTYKKAFNILTDDNINKILSAINGNENIFEFAFFANTDYIKQQEYTLIPSRYIEFTEKESKHRDLQEIADNLNYIMQMQNSCKLIVNETLAKKLGLNIEDFKKSKEISESTQKTFKQLGINLVKEDHISFTKNKNEFVFKCNDSEIVPELLLQMFTVWKNQIALLNAMQNKYLAELRDALLPDLMSGKISF